jgi:putative hydrolase of the HAD superfamily
MPLGRAAAAPRSTAAGRPWRSTSTSPFADDVQGPSVSVRGVVFDLDGTIVDHRGSVASALRGWLPELGATPDDDLFAAWLAAERRHFPDWRARRITFDEQRRRRLKDFLPLIGHPVGDDQELDAVFSGYLSWYQRSWTAFEDVPRAVETVTRAGLPIAVLTNGRPA